MRGRFQAQRYAYIPVAPCELARVGRPAELVEQEVAALVCTRVQEAGGRSHSSVRRAAGRCSHLDREGQGSRVHRSRPNHEGQRSHVRGRRWDPGSGAARRGPRPNRACVLPPGGPRLFHDLGSGESVCHEGRRRDHALCSRMSVWLLLPSSRDANLRPPRVLVVMSSSAQPYAISMKPSCSGWWRSLSMATSQAYAG
jgi:hypothetical protein